MRPSGEMEIMVAGGCTLRCNDIGLRQSVSSACTDAGVASAKQAMNSYPAEHKASR